MLFRSHMTGGSYTKLKDILNDADVEINNSHKLKPQKIFYDLYDKGISDEEMYKTFNCGVGFIISVPKEEAEKIVEHYKDTDIIGKVISGSGKVKVKSYFSNKEIGRAHV